MFGPPQLSPDGKSVAVWMFDPGSHAANLWLFDLARDRRIRLASEPRPLLDRIQGRGAAPLVVWSPDGKSVIFSLNRDRHSDLCQKATDGSGPETLLFRDDHGKRPVSCSPDGRFLLFTATGDVFNANARQNAWVLPMIPNGAGERKPFRLNPDEVNDYLGTFSPDGRFVAYASEERQRSEVSVISFSSWEGAPTSLWKVSSGGGFYPRWRRDGKEMFFFAPDGAIMAAETALDGDSFQVKSVKPLFKPAGRVLSYDVSADGQRFLVPLPRMQTDSDPVILVQNWKATLQ
jgi:Tol biopolymer transport system component